MSCDTAAVVAAIKRAARAVAEHREELIELDRVIGDGDHGANLDRGFTAVVSALDATPPESPSQALKLTAMKLMSTVGGASGPLLGTAFLRASLSVAENAEVDIAEALTAALKGVVDRGKAVVGDKTMVDALAPAVEVALAGESLQRIAEAAEEGARSTVPLVARKGRASYLGDRSAGHIDPGARSTALILKAFAS